METQQQVILQAWGQNAHFFYGVEIGSQTWINDKPYVVIHSILVDSNENADHQSRLQDLYAC
jgi:hypothetical protein